MADSSGQATDLIVAPAAVCPGIVTRQYCQLFKDNTDQNAVPVRIEKAGLRHVFFTCAKLLYNFICNRFQWIWDVVSVFKVCDGRLSNYSRAYLLQKMFLYCAILTRILTSYLFQNAVSWNNLIKSIQNNETRDILITNKHEILWVKPGINNYLFPESNFYFNIVLTK